MQQQKIVKRNNKKLQFSMAQEQHSKSIPLGSQRTVVVKIYNPYGDLVGGKFNIVQGKVDKVSSNLA